MHDDHEASGGEPETSSNPWADRVNEAYYDRMGADFGRQTRDRINWMCAQATGNAVLDVGCSQGISSILLAREGMRVVGLDIYLPAIQYAIAERDKEIESVASRLDFRCSELAAVNEELFDTVLMGEVIEHQTNPSRFVEHAARLVAPKGRLIITVPFGLHPWPDHKSSIFPRQLYASIAGDFRITHLDVISGYIRVVLDRRVSPCEQDTESERLLAATEKGAVEAQSSYYELNTKLQTLTKASAALQARLDQIQVRHDELVKRQQQTDKDLALKSQLAEFLQRGLDESRSFASEQARQVNVQMDNRDRCHSRIDDLQQQMAVHKALSEQSSQAIVNLEQVKQSLERQKADLQHELDALRQVHDQLVSDRKLAEKSQHEEELAELASELSIAKARVHELSESSQLHKAAVGEAARRASSLELELVAAHRSEKEHEQTLQVLKDKLQSLENEHAIAQHWRSEHHRELQAERNRSQKLISLAQELHRDNQLYRHSIALEIGRAVLELRHLRGIFRFPGVLFQAWKTHRRRGDAGQAIEPLVLPRLEAVSLTPLKKNTSIEPNDPLTVTAHVSDALQENMRKELSALGWTQEVPVGAIPVVSVLDDFSRSCFAPHASLIEPRPDNWEALLDAYHPKFLLVESAWRGNHGTWQYRVANYANSPGRELSQMVEGFRARGIPTVFWNKEDPVHFNDFIPTATNFDFILTTASEMIPEYRDRTSAQVGALQFAAEESLHNPIGSARRNGKVCFAGSFYANGFHERRSDQLMLLDAASNFDFDIFDRNHGHESGKSDFAFPDKYSRFIRGQLPYEAMGRIYREYRVFLNVNSVVDSPTMFSRRVFELLACGTPIVSTWARGSEEAFGKDLVWHVRSKEEAVDAIRVLMTDDREWRRRSLAGVRAVLSQHTFQHRFNQILDTIGVKNDRGDPLAEVLVVSVVEDSREASRVLASFERQHLGIGIEKKLILVCRRDCNVSSTHDIEPVISADLSIAEVLGRNGRFSEQRRMIAKISPGAIYGRHYLQDLLLAARYSGAAVVGKPKDVLETDLYSFGAKLDDHAILVNEDVLVRAGGELSSALAGNWPEGDSRLSKLTYAADSANFMRVEDPLGREDEILRRIEF